MLFLLGACSAKTSGKERELLIKTDYGDISKDDLLKEVASTERGQELIQKLVYMQILKGKYEVSDKEVNQRLGEIKEQFGDKDQYSMFLQKQGFKNEEELKDHIEQSLYFFKATTEGVKVSDKQIKDYYEQHKSEYTEARTSHILVDHESTAKEIEKELKKGTDFAEIAKKQSTDTATAAEGGDLGYLSGRTQEMDPTFLAAALKLKKGEVSEPVKTVFGYHIIKVTDIKETPLSQVKDQIKQTLMSKKAKPVQEILNSLKKEIEIEEDAFKDAFKEIESK
ncbi:MULTISPECIES: peptidylprolyl isomerase [Bacillaceae]|uniref:peptidylprolyl isomerase n=1 Tax=Bacillaceae TaxID=186817 RepID=UPI001642A028|nr:MULTISPECIES: peptidylprolyl isomerase [Bacillaceae]MCM3122900.1 peptidylprolyl isomerase [Mesobacillus sp. MER 33]MCM3233617.1 peptidylprolyl isomerase [Mesobacillus sp. MER 48]